VSSAIQRASPLEALSLYLEHQKVDPTRRDTLLRYARTLMVEESELDPAVFRELISPLDLDSAFPATASEDSATVSQ
jgi:hypothetical protein